MKGRAQAKGERGNGSEGKAKASWHAG